MGLKLIWGIPNHFAYRLMMTNDKQLGLRGVQFFTSQLAESAYLLFTEHLQQTIVVDSKVEVLQTPRLGFPKLKMLRTAGNCSPNAPQPVPERIGPHL